MAGLARLRNRGRFRQTWPNPRWGRWFLAWSILERAFLTGVWVKTHRPHRDFPRCARSRVRQKSAPEDCRRKNVGFKEMRRDGETRPRVSCRHNGTFGRCIEHNGAEVSFLMASRLVADGWLLACGFHFLKLITPKFRFCARSARHLKRRAELSPLGPAALA